MVPTLAVPDMHVIRLIAAVISALALLPAVAIGDIVKVGAGSYTTTLPEGAKTPPEMIYRTANSKGPMPTNDWWSSLAWVPFSDAMYPHPLAVRAVDSGMRIYYPGANLTANNAAIFGFMPGGDEDFVIGHSGVAKFASARVDGFSDWFVSALFEEGDRKLRATFGHGSPFVFVTVDGGSPTLNFGKAAPNVWSGSAQESVLGISVKNRNYGVFAPTASTWSDLSQPRWTPETKGKNYFAIAVLPDDRRETLELFRRYAYSHVIDSRVAWAFDEAKASVSTTFNITTRAYEGAEKGTLFALYPHQWNHTKAALTGHAYSSVRGAMKLSAGESFATTMTFPGTLPSLPLTASCDRKILDGLLTDALSGGSKLVADTYWLGKQLGKWATLIPLAEQAGKQDAVAELTRRLRASLENFLTASDANGAAKKRGDGVFYYDARWGTLIGYPASYDSDTQLNDHHFHYGYFIRAAGELARRDASWARDWGGMVNMLIRDIASADRQDSLFPFLRCFDPYAGHTWASGHAKFADGNNNESSSEAVNAWYGMLLWGTATGDRTLRDLAAWLYTTEIAAIDAYWFDVSDANHHPNFAPSVVTMVWGGKGANGTWFSANPELVHGINWLPITGGSLYLGRYPEYCAKNYTALVTENTADNAKKAARSGGEPAPGEAWDQWADIIWMYRGLSDSAAALRQFNARSASFKPEGGNAFAITYAWLTALSDLGQVDRTITADTPLFAVFNKAGKRSHVAWNLAGESRTVTFSDGVTIVCPPGKAAVK
jgi:endoglucanase Acf2